MLAIKVITTAIFTTGLLSLNAFAGNRPQSLTGHWEGMGTVTIDNKVDCAEAKVSWDLKETGEFLDLSTNTICPKTGKDYSGMNMRVKLRTDGVVKITAMGFEIPGSSGSHDQDKIKVSFRIPLIGGASAQISFADGGRADVESNVDTPSKNYKTKVSLFRK